MSLSTRSSDEDRINSASSSNTADATTTISHSQDKHVIETPQSGFWMPWYVALKRVLPVYVASHIAFFLLSYLANLFVLNNFSPVKLPLHTLMTAWNRWDTGQFTGIATAGYTASWQTAFFPLYPLFEASLSFVTRHSPFTSGLIISNLALLCLFIVLYRLAEDDFGADRAYRTVLYLALFPTAFFLVAAYNESLFLCLVVASFYAMRHGQWWLAGLLGFFASLTRSAGLLLFIPFLYEYARQHHFKMREVRFGIVASLFIPAGLALFALYCFLRFADPLAFSHAQSNWDRSLQLPWQGLVETYQVLRQRAAISFDAIHSVIDMSAEIFMLGLVVLSFVGPWRFSREQRAYSLYFVVLFLFLILFPSHGSTFPLQSLSRLMLELFPAFIVLSALGKRPQFNLYYLTISVSFLAFMLLQYLTGHWIV